MNKQEQHYSVTFNKNGSITLNADQIEWITLRTKNLSTIKCFVVADEDPDTFSVKYSGPYRDGYKLNETNGVYVREDRDDDWIDTPQTYSRSEVVSLIAKLWKEDNGIQFAVNGKTVKKFT